MLALRQSSGQATAGIQRDSALAYRYTSWILSPGSGFETSFAGITPLQSTPQNYCDSILETRSWRLAKKRKGKRLSLSLLVCLLLFFPLPLVAQDQPENPSVLLEAFDLPGDTGNGVGLRWLLGATDLAVEKGINAKKIKEILWAHAFLENPGSSYRIFASEQRDGDFKQVAELPANKYYKTDIAGPWWVWGTKRKDVHFFQVQSSIDFQFTNGTLYFFKIVLTDGQQTIESPIVSVIPQANLFNWSKLNNLFLTLAFGAVVLFSIRKARGNPNIFLRRIPGLDAVEEAVGRATEMGKPVLYLTGSGELGSSGDPSSLATIAATVILGDVAKRTAAYGADLKVPHRSSIVMAVSQEIVKESYFAAGRPDTYKEDSNFFITGDQFAYTAAVDGMILRERPAANFFLGYYYAEALLLAETGASTGAIQIAGTDAEHQLPFFITTCDYTLIGEELYAASAYLSREPVLVGTLHGQDIGKGFFLAVMVFGTIFVTLGDMFAIPWFRMLFQFFSDTK